MFGYWLPEPVYRSKPYVLLGTGTWAVLATNPMGAASGVLLLLAGMAIWKLRH